MTSERRHDARILASSLCESECPVEGGLAALDLSGLPKRRESRQRVDNDRHFVQDDEPSDERRQVRWEAQPARQDPDLDVGPTQQPSQVPELLSHDAPCAPARFERPVGDQEPEPSARIVEDPLTLQALRDRFGKTLACREAGQNRVRVGSRLQEARDQRELEGAVRPAGAFELPDRSLGLPERDAAGHPAVLDAIERKQSLQELSIGVG